MTDDVTIPPELAPLASAHPDYVFSRRYHVPGIVRYTAQAARLDVSPWCVITHDLGELAAILAAGSDR